jgi:nitrate reductase gamma subunit
MKALLSLMVVLALVLLGLLTGHTALSSVVAITLVPCAALAVLIAGVCCRVLQWAATPVPFNIPTTCGQQKSLPWIRPSGIDNPATALGVTLRMAAEVFLFRSLFRNSRAQINNGRLIQFESKLLWLTALAFHFSLLLIVLRHLRLFVAVTPSPVNALERLDGFLQIGAPSIYLTDAVLTVALSFLIVRRLCLPAMRYVSLFTDYFALFLLSGIATTGMLLRYVERADVAGIKQLMLGIVSLHPALLPGLSSLFFVHLLLVCTLAAYFPFSKLMHAGGVFLSPTRNLANDSRSKRHINPWNYPVKTHTYAEWEEEFRDKLEAAEIPLEAKHAEPATHPD